MLTAYHPQSSGQVLAAEQSSSNGPFFCSACGGELLIRKGLKRIHHFAHLPEKVCRYKGESQLHLRIKKQIYFSLLEELGTNVKDVFLEKMIDTIRPDVLVEGFKKNIGIEIQVTPLTPAELIRRTVAYYERKIHVLWVLPFSVQRFFAADDGEFQPVRLKAFELMLYYMNYKSLIFWDDTEKLSEGFIRVEFGDIWQKPSSFYSIDWSTVIEFNPKKLKQKKMPTQIEYNLGLKEFKPVHAPAFPMPKSDYFLPNRFIMLRDAK